MSRQPKSKRLAVNDQNKGSKAPQDAKMIPVTKAADLAKYVTPAPMAPNKGQMIPEAPWKALPNLTRFPDDAATGTVYTAAEAFQGNEPSKYQDPMIDNSYESDVGGFIDTGLLMRQTKEFNTRYPDPKKDSTPSTGPDISVGGFPVNPQAPGMTTPLFNVGYQPIFPARFSAEEARSTNVAGTQSEDIAASTVHGAVGHKRSVSASGGKQSKGTKSITRG
jgi:hypothetical protein